MPCRKSIFSILHLTIFLFLSTTASADSSGLAQQQILGEWKGTDSTGETASLIFYPDGRAEMRQGRMVLDDKTAGGKVTWELDSQDPMHLDLVITVGDRERRMLMILRFVSDTQIQVQLSIDDTTRVRQFGPPGDPDQVTLTKQP